MTFEEVAKTWAARRLGVDRDTIAEVWFEYTPSLRTAVTYSEEIVCAWARFTHESDQLGWIDIKPNDFTTVLEELVAIGSDREPHPYP